MFFPRLVKQLCEGPLLLFPLPLCKSACRSFSHLSVHSVRGNHLPHFLKVSFSTAIPSLFPPLSCCFFLMRIYECSGLSHLKAKPKQNKHCETHAFPGALLFQLSLSLSSSLIKLFERMFYFLACRSDLLLPDRASYTTHSSHLTVSVGQESRHSLY